MEELLEKSRHMDLFISKIMKNAHDMKESASKVSSVGWGEVVENSIQPPERYSSFSQQEIYFRCFSHLVRKIWRLRFLQYLSPSKGLHAVERDNILDNILITEIRMRVALSRWVSNANLTPMQG